jgi:hypothetical protein
VLKLAGERALPADALGVGLVVLGIEPQAADDAPMGVSLDEQPAGIGLELKGEGNQAPTAHVMERREAPQLGGDLGGVGLAPRFVG